MKQAHAAAGTSERSGLPARPRPSDGTNQRFGAHLSVAGGLHLAFDAAVRIGCDCLQIFVKNQRQWSARPLSEEQIRAWREAEAGCNVRPVVAHASYLLNLASPDSAARRKSIAALVDELTRCEALGVSGLVVHPGAHMGEGVDSGIRRICESLDEAHHATRGFSVRVLLETTAGQGTSLGHEIRQIGRMVEGVRESERLGVCLDTCHLFAAGYDLRDGEAYGRMMDELAAHVGLARIACIHTNDSKGGCGSRLDRHEHVTKGAIGRGGFANILNDPRLALVPRILETPKGVDGRSVDLDRVNIQRMKRLIMSRGLSQSK
ncbi:MAG: deoxyribonuclease IV [Planctomycetota bacterium]|nr:MAG: deoxyribonuclease IV [Planctomycetota bacterium]